MGLDMYLTKKHYVQNWEHTELEKRFEVTIKQGDKTYGNIDASKVKYIEEEAGYWRKSNHIHRWFVENLQDGIDDCQEVYVSPNKLKELLSSCKEALENKETACELLPTHSGFFFGRTDYDEFYFNDIDYTIKIIEDILGDVTNGELPYSIYYSSSW